MDTIRRDIEIVIFNLENLEVISKVKAVGSYIHRDKPYRDIDLLLTLNINNKELENKSVRQGLKKGITKILKGISNPSLLDLFLVTSDGVDWRLRCWEDTSTKRLSWDWE